MTNLLFETCDEEESTLLVDCESKAIFNLLMFEIFRLLVAAIPITIIYTTKKATNFT